MISRTAFCSAQAARMLAARTGPMPSTSRRRSGVASITSKAFAKGADKLLGVDWTNAADHAGGEIFFDAVDRCRHRGAEEPSLELLAMGAGMREI
jgi:hypothetical protein